LASITVPKLSSFVDGGKWVFLVLLFSPEQKIIVSILLFLLLAQQFPKP